MDFDLFDQRFEESLLRLVVAVGDDLGDLVSDLGEVGGGKFTRWLLKIEFYLGLAGSKLLGLALQFGEPGLNVWIFVVEGALLECLQVAVDRRRVLFQLLGDGGEFVVVRAGGAREVGQELIDCLADDVVPGGVEVEQGLAHRGFQLVGVEAVDVAALFCAVTVSGPAHVVAVAVVASGSDSTDVLAAALRAWDLAGEGVFGGVGGPLADLFAALGQRIGCARSLV